MTDVLVIEGATVCTVDAAGTEHAAGHVVVEGNRISAVGAGPAPEDVRRAADRVLDATGCLLTPGLVNTHQHLYQWATRGLAVDATLFEWLTALYPVWAGIDEEVVRAASAAALGWLARTGCTTSTDHHYVFPAGGGDLLAAEVGAAAAVGLRFHPTRGLDGPRRAARAGCRPTRSSRTWTPSSTRPSRRSPASTTRRTTRCCGSRSRRARRSR